ncbi:MAG: hypothetical protein ABI624_13740 [Casimicrobiaceae bacterium]
MLRVHRLLAAIGLVACLVVAEAADAQDAKPAAKPSCATPEYRQFDFWIGEWDVSNPAGRIVGQNRIARLHGGCVVLESWSGDGGVTGSSLNIYDAERGKWHQTWVDSTGGLLQLEGGWSNGRMVLVSAADPAKPGETINRISWQPLADGRVRQLWETSADGSKSWTTAFDGYYRKQGK